MGAFTAGGIPIPTQGPHTREEPFKFSQDTLGASAKVLYTTAITIRAFIYRLAGVCAMVTHQSLPGAVIGQRCLAARAAHHMTTVAAENVGGGAAAI